jgi:hypothetical protein
MSKFLYNAKISEVHGKPVWVRGRLIVPMFHPAAALHQPSLKVSIEQDFAHLPEFIQQAQQDSARHAATRTEAEAQPADLSDERTESGRQTASVLPETAQQSLFGDLLNVLQVETPKAEEDLAPGKDQPTQLSLF